jgi:hypothetical protein
VISAEKPRISEEAVADVAAKVHKFSPRYVRYEAANMLIALRAEVTRLEAALVNRDARIVELHSLANERIMSMASERDAAVTALAAAEADKVRAVEAETDSVLDLIDNRFSGALACRDAARNVRDTTGAVVHQEAVTTLAELRAAIRARSDAQPEKEQQE